MKIAINVFNIHAFLLVLVSMPLSLSAQPAGSIKLKSQAFKEVEVVNDKGEKEYKLIEPTTALPKEEILYVTTFTNVGDTPATNIVITNPISPNLLYKEGSAFGSGTSVTFSIDGGKQYAEPTALTIKNADGTSRPAVPTDYTHIRWVFTNELAPAAESTVNFRAVIK